MNEREERLRRIELRMDSEVPMQEIDRYLRREATDDVRWLIAEVRRGMSERAVSEQLEEAINGVLRVADTAKYMAPELIGEWFQRFGVACDRLHRVAEAHGATISLTGAVFGKADRATSSRAEGGT